MIHRNALVKPRLRTHLLELHLNLVILKKMNRLKIFHIGMFFDEQEDLCEHIFLTALYRGTVGTRILEFDIKLTSQQAKKWNGNRNIEIEMWDCSGNIAYESCWPALQADSVGVVLVYNPENATSSSEVVSWYEWFVTKAGLSHEQCLILANDRNSGQGDPRAAPPHDIEESEIIYTDSNSADKIRQAFTDFIGVIGKYRR